jgi:hypothetical protein
MKRDEIKIGTEYAATGKLAYGVEPRVRARRVRFTEKTPAVLVRTWVKAAYPGRDTLAGLAYVTRANRPVETPRYSVGEGETWVEVVAIPGGLPAQTMNSEGEWVRTLVAPAEVHRTWETHQADLDAQAARRAAAAPHHVETLLVSTLVAAMRVEGIETKAEAVAYVEGLLAQAAERAAL